MDVEQWWWLHEVKSPKDSNGYAGRLTESDVRELYELIDG